MPEILKPTFVHQANGQMLVSDGTAEVAMPLAIFVELEPGYALPEGAVARSYSRQGDRIKHFVTLADGSVQADHGPVADKAVGQFDGYIAKVAIYQAALAERAHPLYGVNDLSAARLIAERAVSQLFEAKADELFRLRSKSERDTFERQLAEARAWIADNGAETPLVDGILLPGETKQALCDTIITHAEAFTTVAASLLLAKRTHVATIYNTLNSVAALKGYISEDINAGWPSLIPPEV